MIAAVQLLLMAAPAAAALPPPSVIEIRKADGSLAARAMVWQRHARV